MRLADLENARVAVWGYGREGRAALVALRRRFPEKTITLLCSADEAKLARDNSPSPPTPSGERVGVRGRHEGTAEQLVSCVAPPDHPTHSNIARGGEEGSSDAAFEIITETPDAKVLAQFDIVIKSPGISPYKAPLPEAQAAGVRFTSGTALWFAENPAARVIGVTGTKGKSTTSALIAHLARALGVRTALAGNIGMPLLDLDAQTADLWVVELSSFQTSEAGALEVGVVTNLFEEHLDWHGSPERYAADKLKLADAARTLIVDATQSELVVRTSAHPQRITFGDALGWHVRENELWRGDARVLALHGLPLPGEHNARNVCAALAALDAAGFDVKAAAAHVASFTPLPHRLQALGSKDGHIFVNDSISTTPHATIEALRSLAGRAVTVIVGGFDRGIDWSAFVDYVGTHPPHAIVTSGANGARIASAVRDVKAPHFALIQTTTLEQAIAAAYKATPTGGTIVLSPGAPSFDAFHDYAERGRAFARLAGFDPAIIANIEGLGIA